MNVEAQAAGVFVSSTNATTRPGLDLRTLRSEAELLAVRDVWLRWQQHPHTDYEFFLTIARVRPEVISPYVIAVYRDGQPETLLLGRLEQSCVDLSVGYLRLFRFPVRQLTFVYRGVLGNASPENCRALVREVQACLKREKAQVAHFHFVPVDSPMYRAVCEGSSAGWRDLTESRPHWVMRLPSHVDTILNGLSAKARKNRRYEAARLMKDFDNDVRVECYSNESDLPRILDEAESIACRTYQRGLGVGFVANDENRERFLIEAQRGRFRGYFLYLRGKPVAFFLGTLDQKVLYDNFTSYDPEYSKYSPGTYLFYQIFERICGADIEAIDFGFGDAWYKSHFGTEQSQETNISVFARGVTTLGLNVLRIPIRTVDRLGKYAVANMGFLRSIKKKWRDRAQRRAAV